MADELEIKIKINADGSAAIQGVDRLEKKLQGVGSSARQGFGNATREAGMLESSLSNLKTLAIGFGTAMIANVGIQGVMQLREMGAEAEFAQRRFEALAGGPDRVGAAMDTLREKTGGAVSDMQLQTDAAGLMLTGLAATAEEAGDLIALGLQLGGEQGVDALSRALKNNSIEMLDNLGISAAAVRELRDQYTAAGMDSATAFAQATLEIGRQTAERLGDAATAGITNWDRLQARIQNGLAEIGMTSNNLFEAMSEDMLEILDAHDAYWEAAAERRRQEVNAPPDPMDFENWDERAGLGVPEGGSFEDDPVVRLTRERQLRGVIARETAYAGWQQTEREREINRLIEARTREAERAQQAVIQGRMDSAIAGMTSPFLELQAMSQGFSSVTSTRGLVGDQFLFSDEDARRAGEIARHLEGVYRMAQNNRDLVSEQSLEAAKNMAEQGRQWQQYVESGVDALDNLTVPQLFGQGVTNPLLAGLGADFLGGLGELTDEQRRSIQDRIDLLTGAQTAESIQWRDEGVPALEEIYRTRGEQDAVAALLAYEEAVRNAKLSGLELPDPLSAFGYVRLASGGLEERQAQGWTPYGLDSSDMSSSTRYIGSPMGSMLTEVDDLTAKIDSLAATSLPMLAGAITPAADEMGKVRDVGLEIQGTLDVMSSKEYPLKFALVASESGLPAWLKQAIRDELVTLTRNNGGVVPGTDARARANQSTRSRG